MRSADLFLLVCRRRLSFATKKVTGIQSSLRWIKPNISPIQLDFKGFMCSYYLMQRWWIRARKELKSFMVQSGTQLLIHLETFTKENDMEISNQTLIYSKRNLKCLLWLSAASEASAAAGRCRCGDGEPQVRPERVSPRLSFNFTLYSQFPP